MKTYQQLNPLALALGFGIAALVTLIIVAFPMAGVMGASGGMMGYGAHMGWFGFGFSWFGVAIVAALGGAVCAWIYNAVNGASVR